MNILTIIKLSKTAHENAKAKGFYDEPKDIPTLIALIVSESGEIVEALRKDRWARLDNYDGSGGFIPQQFEAKIKDTVQDEIADTIIRLLDFIGFLGEDIVGYADVKPVYNSNELWSKVYLRAVNAISQSIDYADDYGINFSSFSVFSIQNFYVLSHHLGIDNIEWFILEKMKYNLTRPHKHGKKF